VARASKFTRWFDHWMFDEFALSGADLAIFRVVYALAALLLLVPDFEIVNRYPDTFYSPPPGIMAVFTRFPPAWVPTALEIGIAIGLVAILVGYMTTLASWATTFMWLYGNGLVYSMAKINHGSLLFSITPVFLSLAGWGNRFSLDAWRRGRYRIVRRWPLTLFAVTIGGMFVTAAIPKIEAGWLHLSTHAVQRAVIAAGSGPEFATEILKIHSPIFWEGVDYSTILLETGLVLAALSLRSFRAVLSVAVLFHAAIFFVLGISFVPQVLAYGAFVSWHRLDWRTSPRAAPTRVGTELPALLRILGPPVAIVAVGVALQAFGGLFDSPSTFYEHFNLFTVTKIILVTGSAVALSYLVALAVMAVAAIRRRFVLRRLAHRPT
jgi:hypothetical protein